MARKPRDSLSTLDALLGSSRHNVRAAKRKHISTRSQPLSVDTRQNILDNDGSGLFAPPEDSDASRMLMSPPPEEMLRSGPSTRSAGKSITQSDARHPFTPSLLAKPSSSSRASKSATSKRKRQLSTAASPAKSESSTILTTPNTRARKHAKRAVTLVSEDSSTLHPAPPSKNNASAGESSSSRRPSTPLIEEALNRAQHFNELILDNSSPHRGAEHHRQRPANTTVPYEPPHEHFTSPREVYHTPPMASSKKQKFAQKSKASQKKLVLTIKKEPPEVDLTLPLPPPSPTPDPLLLSGDHSERGPPHAVNSSRHTPPIMPASSSQPHDTNEDDSGSLNLDNPVNAYNTGMTDDMLPTSPFNPESVVVEAPDVWSDSGSDDGMFDEEGEYTGRFVTFTVPIKQDPPDEDELARMEAWGRPVSPVPESMRRWPQSILKRSHESAMAEFDESQQEEEPLQREQESYQKEHQAINDVFPVAVDVSLEQPDVPLSPPPHQPTETIPIDQPAGRDLNRESPSQSSLETRVDVAHDRYSAGVETVVDDSSDHQVLEGHKSIDIDSHLIISELLTANVKPAEETVSHEVGRRGEEQIVQIFPPEPELIIVHEHAGTAQPLTVQPLGLSQLQSIEPAVTPAVEVEATRRLVEQHANTMQPWTVRPFDFTQLQSDETAAIPAVEEATVGPVAMQQDEEEISSDDETEPLEEGVVEVTSSDPMAAARAAAILKMHNYDCLPRVLAKNRRSSHIGVGSFVENALRKTLSEAGIRKQMSLVNRRHTLGGESDDQVVIPGGISMTPTELLEEAERSLHISGEDMSGLLQPRSSLRTPGRSGMRFDISRTFPATPEDISVAFDWTKKDWRRLDSCFTDERLAVGSRQKLGSSALADADNIRLENVVDRFIELEGGVEALMGRLGFSRESLLRRTQALQKKQRSGKIAPPTPNVPRVSRDVHGRNGAHTSSLYPWELLASAQQGDASSQRVHTFRASNPAVSTAPSATTKHSLNPSRRDVVDSGNTSATVPSPSIAVRTKGLFSSYLPASAKPSRAKSVPSAQPSLPTPPPEPLERPRSPGATSVPNPASKLPHAQEMVELQHASSSKPSLIPRSAPSQSTLDLHAVTFSFDIRRPLSRTSSRRSSVGSVKDLVLHFEELNEDTESVRPSSSKGKAPETRKHRPP
ncbi:uncharacterized protein LAESUDRAFT_816633 [Laetiporus sulphureus 93-53]|uniref:Uncharacterized protein n=1 Tax=Laetiporus sulphureus 93-53 TaxID=1314785 RepID=A0A165B4Z5_9APHY|nr:uncharacterized protein LAESUDRAFT_816633 [Laetiporus sulphureus 93-53]KZT00248.1 hypothetical protein LAESUDRAFT_816633 [Laetiporus sulphureus 93-53]